ncbi:hypothetical protein, partial [Candidatus Mycoplasma haematohominis]|uniref:hypothetical protein n=1 Tax=Candidatus Mycoplasma haematohominis TaxID=1494318 RepID=UPI001C0A720B
FTSKYLDFEDYVKSNDLVYAGDIPDANENSIKKLLDEDKNDYRSRLSGKWISMPQSVKKGTDTVTKPVGNASTLFQPVSGSTTLAESTKIAAFTKAWCESKKGKVSEENKTWTKDTLKKDSDWQIFEEVCLI